MANNNRSHDSKLSRAIETLNFLKEYAQDANRNFEDVAIKLGISDQNAENYLRKYIYLVKNTEKDKDFPRRARLVLNNNVPNEFHITDEELKVLHPLVEEYDLDTNINDENTEAGLNQPLKNFDPNSKSSMIRKPLDDKNNNNDPREQSSPDYARLPMSSRSDILRYVLNKFTHVHFSKKEPFISLFEADEPNLVADPMKLQKVMTNYFGPNLGDAIFERFSEMVRGNLPPTEQLGNNPWRSPMGHGMGMQGGYGMQGYGGPSSYYAAIGVIPLGVDPYSPEARQVIDEYERKKRARENSEEIQDRIKELVNLKMVEVIDPERGRKGGGGMGANMEGLLAAGLVQAEQFVDQNGNMALRYVPRPAGQQQGQGGGFDNQFFQGLVTMYNTMFQKQTEFMQLPQSLLSTLIDKTIRQTNPIESFMEAKKMADVINPPVQQQLTLQAQDLHLKEKRLEADVSMAKDLAAREERKMQWERERDFEMEKEAQKSQGRILDGIFSIGDKALQNLGPVLTMLNNRGGLGGLLGGGAAAGGMQQQQPPNPFAGGGARPAYVQQPQPQPDYGRVNPNYRPQPQPQQRYAQPVIQPDFNNLAEQQRKAQAELQMQAQAQAQHQANQARQKIYTTQDFANMSVEELEKYMAQGNEAERSISSFQQSLKQVYNQKKFNSRQSRQVIAPTQAQTQTQQVQETITTTTTNNQAIPLKSAPKDSETASLGDLQVIEQEEIKDKSAVEGNEEIDDPTEGDNNDGISE